ncbi:Uncharacterised protein [Candidatus Gugararchaeum adminiculabundum]|nr:Uncharacterised protein [Candidatus Gugararchaeum adminiculabundum]
MLNPRYSGKSAFQSAADRKTEQPPVRALIPQILVLHSFTNASPFFEKNAPFDSKSRAPHGAKSWQVEVAGDCTTLVLAVRQQIEAGNPYSVIVLTTEMDAREVAESFFLAKKMCQSLSIGTKFILMAKDELAKAKVLSALSLMRSVPRGGLHSPKISLQSFDSILVGEVSAPRLSNQISALLFPEPITDRK